MEFDEFVRVMGNVYQREFTHDEMRRAFQCFDADHSGKTLSIRSIDRLRTFARSGFITIQELQEVLKRLNHPVSEDQLRAVMQRVDTDHDGKISFEEFVRIVQEP